MSVVKRRLYRVYRVLAVLTAVSLGLFIATAALWVRSYWVDDVVAIERSRVYAVGAGHGAVVFSVRWGGILSRPRGFTWVSMPRRPLPKSTPQDRASEFTFFFGVGAVIMDSSPPNGNMVGGKQRAVIMLDAGLVVLFAVLPMLWLSVFLRMRKRWVAVVRSAATI
jgi:hypothetical protein